MGKYCLQDARHAAEGEIYTKLNQKIDEFIQLADYEWGMAESDGRASGYLMDLINFLRSTFQVFTHLPVSWTSLLTSDPVTLTIFFWELWAVILISSVACIEMLQVSVVSLMKIWPLNLTVCECAFFQCTCFLFLMAIQLFCVLTSLLSAVELYSEHIPLNFNAVDLGELFFIVNLNLY